MDRNTKIIIYGAHSLSAIAALLWSWPVLIPVASSAYFFYRWQRVD